jgi:drug/metabolite transporter (DMT)-like permease
MPFFFLTAILEAVGQISLKKAALENRAVAGVRYYISLTFNKWAISGILSYGVETLLWIFLLSRIPLSIAFPLAGVQQLVILFASYVIMKERITRLELVGAGLIALGLLTIAGT